MAKKKKEYPISYSTEGGQWIAAIPWKDSTPMIYLIMPFAFGFGWNLASMDSQDSFMDSPSWVFATIGVLLVFTLYNGIGSLINRSTFTISQGILKMSHGPIPMPWVASPSVPVTEINYILLQTINYHTRLRRGTYHGLTAVLSNGKKKVLMKARFVEDQAAIANLQASLQAAIKA